MTDEQVLRLVRMGDEVAYIDGEGQRKKGECGGWGIEAFRLERYMLIETSSGHEKRVPLSRVLVKRFFS